MGWTGILNTTVEGKIYHKDISRRGSRAVRLYARGV